MDRGSGGLAGETACPTLDFVAGGLACETAWPTLDFVAGVRGTMEMAHG
jgi:hypothetical protein